MATRRMITSEIWEDDWFGELDFFHQALWIGLFSKCADDQGRLKDNAYLVRSSVFPYKDIPVEEIDAAMAKFETDRRIIRYEVDGKRLVQIMNWWDHQPMQWASFSKLPAPPGWSDRIRTRENNRYVEINWRAQASEPAEQADSSPERSPERSPEPFSRDVQVGRHVPVPVPVPIPVPSDITGVFPPIGGGDEAPSPPTPPIDWPNLDELAASPPVSGVECAQQRPKPPKDPPPPAVQVFHANTQRYPAKSLWTEIDLAIGRDPPGLERWAQTIRSWLGLGWKANNVSGMLDFFRRNEIPPGNNGRGNHGTLARSPAGDGASNAGARAAYERRRQERGDGQA